MTSMSLQPLQQIAVNKYYNNKNQLIVSLPTGLGKTIVAIKIIQDLLEKDLKSKILIICPASIKPNFPDTFKKFKLPIKYSVLDNKNDIETEYKKSSVIIISYNFLRSYAKDLIKYKFNLMIVDEIHKAKDFKSRTFLALWALRLQISDFLGLTASYVSNNMTEFLTLIALVSKIPKYIKATNTFLAYSNTEIPEIVNEKEFKDLVGRWVFIPTKENIKNNLTNKPPEPVEKALQVEMDKTEYANYLYVMNKIDKKLLEKLYNGTISSGELKQISSWLMAAQQTLISPDYIINDNPETAKPSTKVIAIAQKIKNENQKAIIFTPFTTYGVKVIDKTLNEFGIKSRIFSGEVSIQEKKEIITEYEDGKIQCICLTTAGAEGLNLPSCNTVYFASLHFNPEVLTQVMGRALRITSKNPKVTIYYALSYYHKHKTVDYYILNIVHRKRLLRNAIEKTLGESILYEDNIEEDMSAAGLTGYSSYEPVGYVKNKNKIKKNEGVFTSVYPNT